MLHTILNVKINEVAREMSSITNLATTTTVLSVIESKTPNVSDLV